MVVQSTTVIVEKTVRVFCSTITVVSTKLVDVEFQKILKFEMGNLWQQRKEANQKKLRHLNEKWRHQSHPNENKTKGVKYKDLDIDAEVNDKNDKVVQYGGVDMNSNLEAVLSLNPKMMTYSRISKNNVEVELKKL